MRRPDVQVLRRDLRRAELLAERARNLMAEGAEQVDSGRALLAEARQWLPYAGPVKPIKLRTRLPSRPEILLFQACSLLLLVGRRLEREMRARHSFAELVRVRELVNAAFRSLREAWLMHLYARGLPRGYTPVRSLVKSGGITIYFLFALALVFVSKLTRDVFPKDTWWSQYVFYFWSGVCAIAFSWESSGLGILPRAKVFKKILPRVVVLAGLPLLGALLRPDLLRVFAAFSLVSIGIAMPGMIQALRLLRFPSEARILVLPRLYVVFLPRTSMVHPDEKVFVSFF